MEQEANAATTQLREWPIGLSAWIIQDGNYGDFHVGQEIEVAVEFGFEAPPIHSTDKPGAVPIEDSRYKITGRVILVTTGVWVIDIGILVFNEAAPPPGVAAGDIVSGPAYLGVDPFFYVERLAKNPEMPPLIYSWHVNRIRIETAPFIEQGRVNIRDQSKLKRRDIRKTTAWTDDGGNGDYVLHCTLLDVPAKRTSATAT